jgi:carbonic anhydrase/acetyltransferase-like protein (isoleucine patch superfamily)
MLFDFFASPAPSICSSPLDCWPQSDFESVNVSLSFTNPLEEEKMNAWCLPYAMQAHLDLIRPLKTSQERERCRAVVANSLGLAPKGDEPELDTFLRTLDGQLENPPDGEPIEDDEVPPTPATPLLEMMCNASCSTLPSLDQFQILQNQLEVMEAKTERRLHNLERCNRVNITHITNLGTNVQEIFSDLDTVLDSINEVPCDCSCVADIKQLRLEMSQLTSRDHLRNSLIQVLRGKDNKEPRFTLGDHGDRQAKARARVLTPPKGELPTEAWLEGVRLWPDEDNANGVNNDRGHADGANADGVEDKGEEKDSEKDAEKNEKKDEDTDEANNNNNNNNSAREGLEAIYPLRPSPPTLIHHYATVPPLSNVAGLGVSISPDAVIAETAYVHSHATIATGATIEGGAIIKTHAFISEGAVVKETAVVENGAVVAEGAVVPMGKTVRAGGVFRGMEVEGEGEGRVEGLGAFKRVEEWMVDLRDQR